MVHPVSPPRAGPATAVRQGVRGKASIIEENAEVARRLWRAASEADADAIIGLLSPDIVWSTFSSSLLSGSLSGPTAVLDLFARLGELPDQLNLELLDIFSSRNGAVIQYCMHAKLGIESVDSLRLLSLRIRDGVVVHALAFPVDAELENAFWSHR